MSPPHETRQTRPQRMINTRMKYICNYQNEIIPPKALQKMRFSKTTLNLESSSSTFSKPLTTKYLTNHPISSPRLAAIQHRNPHFLNLPECNPIPTSHPPPEDLRDCGSCHSIAHVLDEYLHRLPRENFPDPYDTLADHSGWSWVDPRLHHIYPHVTMLVEQDVRDHVPDGCLLRHELGYILRAIQVRLDMGGCLIRGSRSRSDIIVKVLMLSLLPPQHGRILEAHIDGYSCVVVASSRTYSFERNEDAPVELFCRWLAAAPIGVREYEPRPRHVSDEE
ncbi:hypothetical protein BO78DRAFT_448727 [Aspergillus sclerotiicarbonarius CBS 121057]|uniref:Uncharacterized protein n=1 Tax=Aspergillus sclerotiicarbonarius (strain CBS 121057 / IBT 28362) TaxID=1448318 RepID=A0A319F0G1_ASPSB|nr:hypothetical protein BO78DRAFT_448727 [Aspergillus sclerotiicarbonarius CBS 121057]